MKRINKMMVIAPILGLLIGFSANGLYLKEIRHHTSSDSIYTGVTPSGMDETIGREKKIIMYGDTGSYKGLRTIYLYCVLGSNGEGVLYSLYMANSHHYPRAYHDVYMFLTAYTEPDKLTKEIALSYLRYGIKRNDLQSIDIYENLEKYEK
jgi:hypothetical protein